MRTSSNTRGSGVNNFLIKANGLKTEFGKLPDEGFREWKFTEEQPLIGFYGRSKETSIE